MLDSFVSARRSSFFYPILGAFILPGILGLLTPEFITFLWYVLLIGAFFMSACALARMFYDWKSGESIIRSFFSSIKPIPGGFIFGTNLKMKSFPWVTASLICSNTFLFFVLSSEAVNTGTFFPHGNPSFVHILLSVFSSAFLHSDFSHLVGNMIFLWVFGSILESRVGSSRFWGCILCVSPWQTCLSSFS